MSHSAVPLITRARSIAVALSLAVAAPLAAATPPPAPATTVPAPAVDLDATYAVYARLLAEYVRPAGVRYAAWRADPADTAALRRVVTALDATDASRLQAPERFALYTNLYNAKTLEIVLTGSPRESIKELSEGVLDPYEIFKRPVLQLGGAPLSLEDLEKKLRLESQDPRVHFAVNCASRSCPPVAGEPYRGATFDAQLERATRAFLAAPGSVVASDAKGLLGGSKLELSVSKIFDWYADDFAAGGGVVKFLARHAPSEVARRIAAAGDDVEVVYQDYDWSLNAAR